MAADEAAGASNDYKIIFGHRRAFHAKGRLYRVS
jgi:hypothetical protein